MKTLSGLHARLPVCMHVRVLSSTAISICCRTTRAALPLWEIAAFLDSDYMDIGFDGHKVKYTSICIAHRRKYL